MKTAYLICFLLLSFNSFVFCDDNQDKPIEPKQLFDLFDNADKIVVNKVRKNIRVILFESKIIKDLTDLKQSIEISNLKANPKCKCNIKGNVIEKKNGDEGCDYSIQLFKDNKETIEINIFNGSKISCNLWAQMVSIGNLDKWYAWFDEHKIPRPTKGMPTSIRTVFVFPVPPLFKLMEINTLIEPLKKEIPNQNKRILALFSWYGSGASPWTNCPTYEGIAEKMLTEYKLADIANALQLVKLTDSQKEGAVRYFCVHYNGLTDKRNINELKVQTQDLLWNFVKTTKDLDKLSWAKKTFKRQ